MDKFEEIQSLGVDERTLMRNLPPSLAELARIVGLEAAVKIGTIYGGRELYLPATVTSESQLAVAIGQDAAEQLAQTYGQGFAVKLSIANSLNGAMVRRLNGIMLLAKGRTIAEVAQSVGVSRSTVCEWKRRYVIVESRLNSGGGSV